MHLDLLPVLTEPTSTKPFLVAFPPVVSASEPALNPDNFGSADSDAALAVNCFKFPSTLNEFSALVDAEDLSAFTPAKEKALKTEVRTQEQAQPQHPKFLRHSF